MADTPHELWFVYMLRCADGSYYTGITNDLLRRCRQHNAGTASRYTRSRLPTELIYREALPNRSLALKREATLKALPRGRKKAIIDDMANQANAPMTVQQIQEKLRCLADPVVAASSTRFFKKAHCEHDIFLGLRAATLRRLAKEYRSLPLAEIEILLQSQIHEERALALLILCLVVHRAEDAIRKQVFELYLANTGHVNNWDLVDVSAPSLVGAFLADKSRKPLYRLARSKNLWERRIAMVATQHFIRSDDFADTLKIAHMLLDDDEDLIHKAAGWMLREVGKRDEAALQGFLMEHRSSMPRTMLRYAIEKLPADSIFRHPPGQR